MSFTVKYAPSTWNDIVLSDVTVRDTLDCYIQGGSKTPLILYGDYGVGKTTIANLLPNAIEGKLASVSRFTPDEFANCRDVYAKLDSNINYYNMFEENGQKRSYVIINELNFPPKIAYSFRNVLDKFQAHIQFIFTTNALTGIDKGLCDRSMCLEIKPALAADWLPRAKQIIQAEGITISDTKLLSLIKSQLNLSTSNRNLLCQLEQMVFTIKKENLNNAGNTPTPTLLMMPSAQA
jgi:replication-associated recombination protein RarA